MNLMKIGGVAGLCFGLVANASAETWYLKSSSHNNSRVSYINDLSGWETASGTSGSGTPGASDELIVPSGRTLRCPNATMSAHSLTLNGTFTHDAGSELTFANAGIFLAGGSSYNLNSCQTFKSFSNRVTVKISGKMTVRGTPSKPSVMAFQQNQYSNVSYTVANLIGDAGSQLKVSDSKIVVVDNSVWFKNASAFKGSVTCAFANSSNADGSPLSDDGQYGGRTAFTGLDTPGTLTVGKRWTLGAAAGGVVTRAANVAFGPGARLEVALSEAGASRVEATESLTLDGTVQVFVTSHTAVTGARYPILTAPGTIDVSKFTVRNGPGVSGTAALESETANGVGTLYLKMAGATYYVDATNGNNANDGKTAATAKKTLVAAMALTHLGDTVLAAEGTYDQGEAAYGGCLTSNRVVVPPYVTLEAAGDRAKTFIAGRISSASGNWNGCWSNAVRCVCLRTGSVVKGFTLKDGRTCNGTEDNNPSFGGGAAWGPERGLIVDCVVTNCGSAKRGATSYANVTFLRCWLGKVGCNYEALDYYVGGRVIDSIVCQPKNNAYRNTQFVNCTFPDEFTVYGNGNTELGVYQNCLHLFSTPSYGYQNRNTRVYDSYFCSPLKTGVDNLVADEASRFLVPTEELPYNTAESARYRPYPLSSAVGKADLAAYLATTNGWPYTMRRQFTLRDIYGADRLAADGTLDLGAVQHNPVTVYADAETGSDANDGKTAAKAKKTLAAAVAALQAEDAWEGGVIHAAPGTYDEGAVWYASCSNRVVVPGSVGLVADQGPFKTTIRGAFGDLGNASKAGAAAVRCVYLKKDAWVRGFTITGGSTQKSTAGDWGLFGGGVYGADGGVTVACILTGNAGGGNGTDYRGAAGYGGSYVGCRVTDNYGCYHLHVYEYNRREYAINCRFEDNLSFYGAMDLLNCTVLGANATQSWEDGNRRAWNCYIGECSRGRTYTNCLFKTSEFKYVYNSGAKVASNSYDPKTCRFGIAADFDANGLPNAGSAFVDAADPALYEANIPSYLVAFKDVGYLGQQRVYNGVPDVGAGEYDVRGDFGRILNNSRHVTVDAVSETATGSASGVTLQPGDGIEMTFRFPADGRASFAVGGTVVVTVDGVVVTPADGVYAFVGTGKTTACVKVVNAGTTSALVGVCTLPRSGMVMMIR